MAGAAKKLGFDLILCGEGSADLYAQQTGLLLGELLGVPSINSVGKITINGSTARVERDLEDEVEIVDVPLPAVLSVTTDINVPKIPSMYAGIGPAINYNSVNNTQIYTYASNASGSSLRAGLLPLYGGRHNQKLSQYGNAVWFGLPGQVTVFDPFKISWDFEYGSVQYDDSSMTQLIYCVCGRKVSIRAAGM